MSSGKSSAVAAVASELGCAEPHTGAPGGGERQADMLSDLDAELEGFDGHAIAPPAKRGRGRPPGSPNRTTLDLQKLLRARGYRDPAEFLASIISADPAALADRLGLAKSEGGHLEVAKLQRQAASDLMPYFHAKMPQASDPKQAEARPLVLVTVGADVAGAATVEDGVLTVNVQASQRLAAEPLELEPNPSHDASSHDDE